MSSQYETLGAQYVEAQSSILKSCEDQARAFIRRSLPASLAGMRLLDLGCGNGTDITIYEEMGADVWGLDSSAFMVGEARKVAKRPEQVLLGQIEEIPLPDTSFDVIVSRFALHYASDIPSVFAQLHRVIRPGGKIVLVNSHPMSDFHFQKQKVYGQQEIVTMPLYGGQLMVSYPSHTFSNYLSPVFLRSFDLVDLFEYTQEQRTGTLHLPTAFGIAAVRR
jgi:ubiquinone/menaquinone biosynthesis C-methylase UbiE